MKPTLDERFWAKVDRRGADECWEWTGFKQRQGYGVFRTGPRRLAFAHRLGWELTNGAIAEGLYALHRCDNPACCNPGHLFLGTKADNNRDCREKGRQASGNRNGSRLHPERRPRGDAHWTRQRPNELSRGADHWTRKQPDRLAYGDRNGSRQHPERLVRGEQVKNAKLTEAQVLEIRQRARQGIERRQLATQFGVSASTIKCIVLGSTWRHLLPDAEKHYESDTLPGH